MFFPFLFVIPVILIAAIILSAKAVKILREYERAVVFTLGRFKKVKGPGLVLLIPSSRKWCEWTYASESSRYRPRT